MTMLHQYSIPEIISRIQKHNMSEKYDDDDDNTGKTFKLAGEAMTILIILLVINLILLLVFFYIYAKKFDDMPTWVKILAPVLALLFGPIGFVVALILVFTIKK